MLVVGQQCAGTFCKMHHKLLLCFVCIHMQNGRLQWKYKTEAHYNVSIFTTEILAYIYLYIVNCIVRSFHCFYTCKYLLFNIENQLKYKRISVNSMLK